MSINRASAAESEIEELRRRLDEAEQTLLALRHGEADALLVDGAGGPQVYTLKSASEPYRMLVEQMREGALTLSHQGTILYCNEAFAQIAGGRSETITGGQLQKYIPEAVFDRLAAPGGCGGYETVLKRQDGSEAVVRLSSALLRLDDGELVSAVVTDLTKQHLRQRYEAIVESIEQPAYTLDLDLVIQSWNPGAERLYGYTAREITGRTEYDLCPEDDRVALAALQREVKECGCALSADAIRRRKNGGLLNVIFSLAPLQDGDGKFSGYAAIAYDITERKTQEKMRQLLLDELNHRVKNTLAMVESIAHFTVQQSRGLEDFGPAFSGRLHALARAHNILTATSWQRADLLTLVKSQLMLGDFKEERYLYQGPDIHLEPQAAVNLALVLHELNTNASKHGALTAKSGRVSLAWETSDGGRSLQLQWVETGGPAVAPRSRRGFGSLIIEQSLIGVDGQATMRFEVAGLICDIRLPLS